MPDALADAALDPIRYPLGRFERPGPASPPERAAWVTRLDRLPARLRLALAGLDEARLDTPYREGGWTVRQVVHHLADAHQHLALRVRHALAEDAPTICAFEEDAWAGLDDARTAPVGGSLAILNGVHDRLARLLRTLPDEAWPRTFVHPAQGAVGLDEAVAKIAWHGDHHVAQIEGLRARNGW